MYFSSLERSPLPSRPALAGALGLTFLLALAGCSDSSPDPLSASGDELATALEEVALEADALTEEVLSVEVEEMAPAATGERGDAPEPAVHTRSFSGTRSCPAGGQLAVMGSLTRTWYASSLTLEVEAGGSQSADECAFVREDLVVTVNGGAEWTHFRRRVDGAPDGLQTSSYAGSWTASASNGEERTCSFEFTIVRDPGARTRTIEGTLCGFRVRRGVHWDPADAAQ
jgi:hypothetical protein